MKNPSKLSILLLFSMQLLFITKTNGEHCYASSCGKDMYHNKFSFPFHIEGVQLASCGFPGFDVYCNDTLGNTLIQLPSAGSFIIRNINYNLRVIDLSDPGRCLPRKFMSLNLTNSSPLRAAGHKNYKLYNCSGDSSEFRKHNQIDCLGVSGYTVISVSEGVTISNSNCTFMKFLSVPGDYNLYNSSNRFSLHWDEKMSLTSAETNEHRPTSFGLRSTPGLTVGLVTALVLAVLLCWICYKRHTRANQAATDANRSFTTAPTTKSGLDQITIDTYPVMVIGENGLLNKLNSDTCAICLSDYSPGETLKMLPGCLHCFHADCIGQWLRANAICPICRVSPPRTSSSDNSL